jgi:two-component system CheB/CheR fusion protein
MKAKRKTRPLLKPAETSPQEQQEKFAFPIVGIGASAGGLEAFSELLAALPEDTGMAFVLVQHLSPDHESTLAALLSSGLTPTFGALG